MFPAITISCSTPEIHPAGGHLGVGCAPGKYIDLPASFNLILGKKAACFEAGAGHATFFQPMIFAEMFFGYSF
jgi:hypothetical protein